MDSHQFLFVTCVNDERVYQRCVDYINNLVVPNGYEVQILPVFDATSMANGYNKALQHTAKYKIYLHQDTFISNKNFLADILGLFQAHGRLGLLGMVGIKKLPSNGVWWEGQGFVGKLFGYPNGKNVSEVFFGPVHGSFEEVEAVDGLLMVTQYDLPWREDLFPGFHFYDTSQGREFIQNGYLVGVPNQINPWCIHIGSDIHAQLNSEHFLKGKEIFLKHYGGTANGES